MENNLRVQRAIKNVTQEDVARAVKLSRPAIHAIETKKYIPSTLTALRIALYFEKKLEEVFWLEDHERELGPDTK